MLLPTLLVACVAASTASRPHSKLHTIHKRQNVAAKDLINCYGLDWILAKNATAIGEIIAPLRLTNEGQRAYQAYRLRHKLTGNGSRDFVLKLPIGVAVARELDVERQSSYELSLTVTDPSGKSDYCLVNIDVISKDHVQDRSESESDSWLWILLAFLFGIFLTVLLCMCCWGILRCVDRRVEMTQETSHEKRIYK